VFPVAEPVGAARGEAVAEDEPERPVVAQRATHLPQDRDEVGDVQLGAGLEPEAAAPGAAAPAEPPALEPGALLPAVMAEPAGRASPLGREEVRAPPALTGAPGVAAAELPTHTRAPTP
jgi:hypothetical protein